MNFYTASEPKHPFARLIIPLLLAVTLLTALMSALFNGHTPSVPALLAPLPIIEPPTNTDTADYGTLVYRNSYESIYEYGGGYRSVVSAVPTHYQDNQGEWQPINPAFVAGAEDFTVAANTLTSQSGRNRAWVAAAGEGLVINWQATGLGVKQDGSLKILAQPDEAVSVPPAVRSSDGTELYYKAGWGDPSIEERLISQAGSLEHLMVLHQRPVVDESAEYLVMTAELRLWPGAELWADNKQQNRSFSTTGQLEIHQAGKEGKLVLEPIVAYEQDDTSVAINGEYMLRPADQPDTWLVEVRTPWSWWADEDRNYPAVIDPRIVVLHSTGDVGFGTVYVSDYTQAMYDTGWMRLGPVFSHDELTRGYVQFNTMPALPTSLQGSYLTSATLRVAPAGYWAPDHGICHPFSPCEDGYEEVGTQFLFADGFQMDTELQYLGSCPDDCIIDLEDPNFTMTFNNSPLGTTVGQIQPLVVPKATKAGEQSALSAGVPGAYRPVHGALNYTRWDVSSVIGSWYQQLYDQSPATTGRPTFMLRLDPAVTCPQGPYWDDNELNAKKCAGLDIQAENIQLIIDYQQPVLPTNPNGGGVMTNAFGVPSFNPGVFGGQQVINGDWQTSNHIYQLTDSTADRWRVVAARGDHLLDPATNSGIGLQIWQYPLDENTSADKPLKASSMGLNQTQILFIDERHAPGDTADLRADIIAAEPENDALDTAANYRIEHEAATNWNVQTGALFNETEYLNSAELVVLQEFYLNSQDNLKIKATTLPTVPVEIMLVPPTTNIDNFIVEEALKLEQIEDGLFTFNDNVPTSGYYALVVVNQDRPSLYPGDPVPIDYQIDFDVIRCDRYSIPVERFLPGTACQPIFLPLGASFQAGEYRYVRIATSPDKWLVVYNYAGFAQYDGAWCSINENLGAPVVAQLNPDTDPPPQSYAGDWVVVGQGTICLTNAVSIGTNRYTGDLGTLGNSAVGLATPENNPPIPSSWRGVLRKFMFGDTIYPQNPSADGETIVTPNGDFVARDTNTYVRVDPFRQNWSNNLTDIIPPAVSTDRMVFAGHQVVTVDVLIDFDQPSVQASWDVSWAVKPLPDPVGEGQHNYDFVYVSNPVIYLPAVNTFSGLELRVNPVDPAPGGLDALDHKALGGPHVYQFRSDNGRVTAEPSLGNASKVNIAVITPPDRRRIPSGKQDCVYNNVNAACLDLRSVDAFEWDPDFGEVNTAPWKLPDLQITGDVGSLLVQRPGQFDAFSTDHPDAQLVQQTTLPFSFDTWGGEVTISEGPCGGSGPIVTIVQGNANISLPMIGGEGTYPGQNPISMTYTMCETELHEVIIEFTPPTPVPIGSSGMEVTLLKGKVIIGPASTRITLQVNFQSSDGGSTLSDGKGTITLDTAGLLAINAKGKLVGNFNADFKLNIAWNPLDILLQGDVKYRNSNLITGYLYLHAWRGSGWQNKYPWIEDNNLHFTGEIGGEVSISQGELINAEFFKIPPFTLSQAADISFGEFCKNSGCTPPYPWGVAATVSVFGYKAGIYADSGGPEIILGSKGKTLIDQAGGGSMAAPFEPKQPNGLNIITPGSLQQWALPNWSSALDGLVSDNSTCVYSAGGSRYKCAFNVQPGTGRANFTTSWLNGDLTVSLIDPNGVVYTGSDINAGITFSETLDEGIHYNNFTVAGLGSTGTIIPDNWYLQLDNIGQPPLPPGKSNHFSMLFTADPPVPTLSIINPNAPGMPATNSYNITWQASRGGQPLESNVDLELFYAPIFVPDPLPPGNLFVTFPGNYAEQIGGIDWDPSDIVVEGTDDNGDGVYRFVTDLARGEYAFKVAVGGSWEENYGLYGMENGQNISFTVPISGGPVTFYYDRRDNYIAVRPEDDIVVLVGDMMSEIGGFDWDPTNLVGWLKQVEDDRYVLTVDLPAGNWQYNVALNEGDNFGGPNIPLSVPVDGTAVRFTYDPTSQTISHTILSEPAGIPISVTLDPNTGSYLWDTSGLASGEYLVGGRLNDIQRGNGIITDWAAGTVLINDTTPPPVPQNTVPLQFKGELMVRWDKDHTTPDLAGYQIEYDIPAYNWDESPASLISRTLRILPSPANYSLHEWTHLTGILTATISNYTNITDICVRAYDASNNISGCQPIPLTLPLPNEQPLSAPEVFEITSENNDFFHLNWSEPPIAEGYLIRYGLAGCVVPGAVTIANEGPSPIEIIPSDFNFDFFGLTPNQLYWFEIAPIDQNFVPGQSIRVEKMLIDSEDFNGDGLPDAWADFYNITNPAGDMDQDGLDELGEYSQLSSPWNADSDGDGFYDSFELEWGTDVCGPEKPPYHTQPKLTVFGSLHYGLRTAVQQAPINEYFQIINFGGGQMSWNVSSNASWLTFDQPSGTGDSTITFTADPANLSPGIYSSIITINSLPVAGLNGTSIQETAELEVTFVVMPEIVEPDSNYYVYMPAAFRP